MPSGNPKIIHGASTTQNLGSLSAGQHTAWAVLGQLNHVACDARGSVSFTVAQPTTAPTPSSTGAGGFLGMTGVQSPLMLLTGGMLLIVAVAAGCARRRSA